MAPWHLDAHTAALFDRLAVDPVVRDLIVGFQDATGVQIWLAPLSPPSLEDIARHARSHPFCRAFVAVCEQARAHCLRVHSSMRSQPLKPGVVVRQTCAAGILHAAVPLFVAKRPVALLLISGIAPSSFNEAEAVANLQRLLKDGGYPAVLPAQVACALEDTERRSSRQIDGVVKTAIALAFSLERRAVRLEPTPKPRALPVTLVRAIDYMKKNFADVKRTMPETIAKELGVSPRWLRSLFRKQIGTGLTDWLARYRVLIAMEKLRAGTRPMATVAYQCGFGSVSPFYAAFRKHAKMTPSQFRDGAIPLGDLSPEELLSPFGKAFSDRNGTRGTFHRKAECSTEQDELPAPPPILR